MTGEGFAEAYGVELLYEGPPALEPGAVLEALREACGAVEPVSLPPAARSLAFQFPGHRLTGKGGPAFPRIVMVTTEKPVAQRARQAALTQSWEWPGADDALSRAQATLLVTDVASSGPPYRERLELFQDALLSVIDQAMPVALHWIPSGKFVDPAAYPLSQRPGDDYDPLFGAVNVRLFRAPAESAQESIMDTLGLSALGLRDFQCHVLGQDGESVARVLHNTARYLYEKGDVLEEGHTVPGITPEEPWVCRLGKVLVPPLRRVIDVFPGGRSGYSRAS